MAIPVVKPEDYAKLNPQQKAIIDGIGQQRQANPNDSLYKPPAPPKPTAPTMPEIQQFQAPTYNYMSYDQAKSQAGDRINPEYAMKLQEALTNVKNQAMGSGFYGQLPTVQYSADTAGQIEAQKQSSIAQLAQSLQDSDYQRGERSYDKAFQLWGANNDNAYKNYGLKYGAYRDEVGDSQRLEDIARDERWKNVDNGWRSRDWNRQETWRNQDNAYRDKEFNEGVRQFNSQMALNQYKAARSGGGRGRGGSSSSGSEYKWGDIVAAYKSSVLDTRLNKADAINQFERDRGNLSKMLPPAEIGKIEGYLKSWKDDSRGANYGKWQTPLEDFWGQVDPKWQYKK